MVPKSSGFLLSLFVIGYPKRLFLLSSKYFIFFKSFKRFFLSDFNKLTSWQVGLMRFEKSIKGPIPGKKHECGFGILIRQG